MGVQHTIQVTDWVPHADPDSGFVDRLATELRSKGADVHVARTHSKQALFRAPRHGELAYHCHVCSARWSGYDPNESCPRCSRAGRGSGRVTVNPREA